MIIQSIIGKWIVAIVSTYAPQQELGEDVKDKFYENLISLISHVSENELVMIVGDLNGHVGKDAIDDDGTNGSFGYDVRNLEGERILEGESALDTTVWNTYLIVNS